MMIPSYEKYKTKGFEVVKVAGEGVFLVERDGTILAVNPTLEEIQATLERLLRGIE